MLNGYFEHVTKPLFTESSPNSLASKSKYEANTTPQPKPSAAKLVMLLKAIYIQIAVLILVLSWYVLSKRQGGWDLLIKSLAVSVFLFGLLTASVWIYPPYWGLALLALVFLALGYWKYSLSSRPASRLRSAISNIPSYVLLVIGGYLSILGITGRGQNPDGQTIDLASPFRPDNRACVLSGGLNSVLNQHNFGSEDPQDLGQIYALDFMGFDTSGFRVRPDKRLFAQPKNSEDYLAYGMAVHAPCDGVVVWAVGAHPDQRVGQKVRVKGNSIILACGDIHVWMVHLKSGSLAVKRGDRVKAGQYLARIGNSGHTEEPHLHFHAETIVHPENPWAHGEPVHMRINGRFLARGDCL